MARKRFLSPRRWTQEELEKARTQAIERFVKERQSKGPKQYVQVFLRLEPTVRELFVATNDLRRFAGDVFQKNKKLVGAARFLGGPPVSADDLRTLVGDRLGKAKLSKDLAKRVAQVIKAAWDPVRFPWTKENRAPTNEERDAAVRWTTGIWAVERLRTERRTTSSKKQETEVAAALQKAGFRLATGRRTIDALDALDRGTFSREAELAGTKCDIPVRLHDGRLLAIECKVSNSAVNSVKRLNRETGGKAESWRSVFGDQVVTAAVLAGVFKLLNLRDAQDNQRVTMYWQHDLRPLRTFVRKVLP